MEIQKVMYGIPQAGKFSNDKMKLYLAKSGYDTELITLRLWRHQTLPLRFSLEVDDFGMQYYCQDDITHLLDELKQSTRSLRTDK